MIVRSKMQVKSPLIGPSDLARSFLPERVRHCLGHLYSPKFMVSGSNLMPFITVVNEIKKEYASDPTVFRHLLELLYCINVDTIDGWMKYPVITKRIRYLLKEQTILADNLLYIIHQIFDAKSGNMTSKPIGQGLEKDEREEKANVILNRIKKNLVNNATLNQLNQPVTFYNYCKPAVSSYLSSYGVPPKFTARVSQCIHAQNPATLPCNMLSTAAEHKSSDVAMDRPVSGFSEFAKSRQLYEKTPLSLLLPSHVESSCKAQLEQVCEPKHTNIMQLKEQREELTQKLKYLLKNKKDISNDLQTDDQPDCDKPKSTQTGKSRPQTRSATRMTNQVTSGNCQIKNFDQEEEMESDTKMPRVNNDLESSEFSIQTSTKMFPYVQRLTIIDGEIQEGPSDGTKSKSSEGMPENKTTLSLLYGVTKPSPLACLHRMVTQKPDEVNVDVPVDYFTRKRSHDGEYYESFDLSGEEPPRSPAQLSDNSEYDSLIFQAGGTSDHSAIESSSGDSINDDYQSSENSFHKLLMDRALVTTSKQESLPSAGKHLTKPKHKKRRVH